jgi:hypothetical protein
VKLLLDERYVPITSSIGFIEAEHERVVEAFVAWQRDVYDPVLAEQGWQKLMQGAARTLGERRDFGNAEHTIRRIDVAGPLPHALEALPPLTIPGASRRLWVPTRSAWSAYFDNGGLGTDAIGPMSVLAQRLKCRSLKISATVDTLGTKSLYDKTRRGEYGGSSFQLFGPEAIAHSNSLRAIYAVNDGGRWVFEQSGAPLPFEEPEHYKARRKKDRLPFELLDKYCRVLGIRPFDEDFYLPPERPNATLIEIVAPPEVRNRVREYTLAEVQAGVPWFGKGANIP